MEDQNIIKAREIIVRNRYLSLATCQYDTPWIAPLAYVVDPDYNFYFYSAIDSLHSRQIMQNPLVAFAIFDSTAQFETADGLQISGKADEIERSSLPRIAHLYWFQSFPNETVRQRWIRPDEDFHYPAFLRFYRIIPTKIFKLDQSWVEIDKRVEIPFKELLRFPLHG